MALTKAHNRMIEGAVANVLDYGAKRDGVTDDTAAIQAAIDINAHLPKGSYALNSSLLFNTESTITGDGRHYQGTRLIPTTDTTVFKTDPVAGNHTRMQLSNFMVEGDALTTQPAITMSNNYLFSINDVWLKDCYQGVSITGCDSISFNNLKVMETTYDYAVIIGDSSRNINFNDCNFEASVAGSDNRGKVLLNGTSGYVTSASFYGCQLERSGMVVESGTVKWVGGKIGAASEVRLLQKASDCYIDTDFLETSSAQDFGFNTTIKNAYSVSMATPEHKWPELVSATSSATFGAINEEWVYLTSVRQQTNAAASGVSFDIKDGSTVLDTSPTFNLQAAGTSVGLSKRPHYTYLTCVKNPAGTSGPVTAWPLGIAKICGGKALNTNATFDSGTSTGWSFNDASGSASGSDLLVTPTNASWGIYQSMPSFCEFGKKYIIVAKWNGAAVLTVGNPWDGTPGARTLQTSGVADLYGDGDTVGMLSFQYGTQYGNMALGNLTSSTPVTLKWFAIIEA